MGKHSRSDHHSSGSSSKKAKRSEVVEDDDWVEKPSAVDTIPTAASLSVTAAPSAPQRAEWMSDRDKSASTFDPYANPHALQSKEDFTDGFGTGENSTGSAKDFFASLGAVRQKIPKHVEPTQPRMARTELNKDIFDEQGNQRTSASLKAAQKPKKIEPGSSGSSWRMTKLKRVYEAAEDEGRPIQEVALERYATLEDFEEALEERRFLDERDNPQLKEPSQKEEPSVDEFGRELRPKSSPNAKRILINRTESIEETISRPSSRQSFRKPGAIETTHPKIPDSATSSRYGTPSSTTHVPSVFTPPILSRTSYTAPPQPAILPSDEKLDTSLGTQTIRKPLSQDALNKLQARLLKAKLMDEESEETLALEREYQRESELFHSLPPELSNSPNGQAPETEVRVLPTLDGRGKLYDIGTEVPSSSTNQPGKKRKRKEAYVETRDSKTGEMLRINADDDTTTLEELVRQERFGGGAADQKNMNAELASRIMKDNAFKDDLDYMDEEAERLARKKQKTADQKRLFAIQDFARTKKALDSCQFCYQDTETETVPPQMAMVALGTRTYLALPRFEGLTEGHCYIVPLSHQLNTVESDDDTWEEIKNFMKTLVKMFANQERGVIFYETVVSLKSQRHSYIECVPVSWKIFDDAPAYFRESIMQAESEWSTNKRLIDFSKRPGGFRRSLVPELPYFMVCFDHKGERGYGHVIEGHDGTQQAGEEAFGLDEGEKGGGRFERWFGAEIIGNLMEAEPRKWRRPRRIDPGQDASRVKDFKRYYDKYDWTKMLEQTQA